MSAARYRQAPGLRIEPVETAPAELLEGVGVAAGDLLVWRPEGRNTGLVVDADGARLLTLFRRSRTLADVAWVCAQVDGLAAAEVLLAARPLVERLLEKRLLLRDGDRGRDVSALRFPRGHRLADFELVREVRVVDDSAVYLARRPGIAGDWVALKVALAEDLHMVDQLRHEESCLRQLAGSALAPLLVAVATADAHCLLAVEWLSGTPPLWVARQSGGTERLELGQKIAACYARLHRVGLVHGDVHDGNLLVLRDGSVRLLDFGAARAVEGLQSGASETAVLSESMAPELAAALLQRGPLPPPSAAQEQFSVASLLFEILSGQPALHLPIEREAFLRTVIAGSPRSRAELGLEPWPQLEAILSRALATEPGDRYLSMIELSAALDSVAAPTRAGAPLQLPRRRLDTWKDLVVAGGEWDNELPSPSGSVQLGAAGLALALLHAAHGFEDGELLAAAELWSERAVRGLYDDASYFDAGLDLTPRHTSRRSLFHGPEGVLLVRALVAEAATDHAARDDAIAAFLRCAEHDCALSDLTTGWAGRLLAISHLLELQSNSSSPGEEAARGIEEQTSADRREALVALGRRCRARLQASLREVLPLVRSGEIPLGLAHGVAGQLYCVLVWLQQSGATPAPEEMEMVAALRSRMAPAGRGARLLEADEPSNGLAASWCHGSAGHVLFWGRAARVLGDESLLELATDCGWHVWESDRVWRSLCCGVLGRSAALVRLGCWSGERCWLDRAEELRAWAGPGATQMSEAGLRHSLFRGEVGHLLIESGLARPTGFAFPILDLPGRIGN